ncbi:MAG: HAD-IIA family hydrolase [Acidimicrobiia bacterium]
MALLDEHEHLVLDCDGVVYVGSRPVPGTADVVAAAREGGLGLLFVTNDTSSSAAAIAARIEACGIDVDESEVLHAGRAAALHLAHTGAERVLVLGTEALVEEVRSAGVEAVRTTEPAARGSGWDALVVGQDAALSMRDLKRLVQAWRPGMELLAVNGDRNYPAADGLHVGCGAIAAAVAFAVDTDFVVAGKPSPILFAEADARLGPGRTALLGDTLASDVAGANAAGWTSVWLRRPGAATDPAITPDLVVDDPRDLI